MKNEEIKNEFIAFLLQRKNVVKILMEEVLKNIAIHKYITELKGFFKSEDFDELFNSYLERYGIDLIEINYDGKKWKRFDFHQDYFNEGSELAREVGIAIKHFAQDKELNDEIIKNCYDYAVTFFERQEIKHLYALIEERLTMELYDFS